MKAIKTRLRRIERKCNRLANEINALRASLAPSQSDIDEVIDRLHATARAMKEQSEREREYYSRIAKG